MACKRLELSKFQAARQAFNFDETANQAGESVALDNVNNLVGAGKYASHHRSY
jgi:hypothetical protein